MNDFSKFPVSRFLNWTNNWKTLFDLFFLFKFSFVFHHSNVRIAHTLNHILLLILSTGVILKSFSIAFKRTWAFRKMVSSANVLFPLSKDGPSIGLSLTDPYQAKITNKFVIVFIFVTVTKP